jgi:hypothetical protein
MILQTTADVISRLTECQQFHPLKAPTYDALSKVGPRLVLGVEEMKRHMTDEGWQIQRALEMQGWRLCGYNLPEPCTEVTSLVNRYEPSVVFVQDKREWDYQDQRRAFGDRRAHFFNTSVLKSYTDIFKVTVLKDSHARPHYHAKAADEIGCHAWIVYYHPDIVHHTASYIRREHLIRTYHTVDPESIPPFDYERGGILMSGALSTAYPLRVRLYNERGQFPEMQYIKHPGYHANGSWTGLYLQSLNHAKVSICTSSRYGFALRKIIESVACGAIPVTDLPVDDVLPHIDGALVRVPPDITTAELRAVCLRLEQTYDLHERRSLADTAKMFYSPVYQGTLLDANIHRLMATYPNAAT